MPAAGRPARAGALRRLLALPALILFMVAAVAGCGNTRVGEDRPAVPHSLAVAPTPITVRVPPQRFVPGPLIATGLGLHAGPVAVPLRLKIPAIGVNAAVLGVGLTANDVMDAPQGAAGSSVWRKAFWYRGGGIPGQSGTATIAGHVDDVLGRPAVFARLKDLRPGDTVLVVDTRAERTIHFVVIGTATYSERQASNPAVLSRVYGPGPVAGRPPQPAPDGLAHLTLITCAGVYVHGAYNHHLVVYTQRTATP